MFGKKKKVQDSVEVSAEQKETEVKKKFRNPFKKKDKENQGKFKEKVKEGCLSLKEKFLKLGGKLSDTVKRLPLPFKKNTLSESGDLEKPARKKWSKKKKICTAVGGVVVVALIVTTVIQANMPEPLETVTIATAQLRDIDETIETSGYVQSSYEKTYFAPVSAKIEECNVTVGSMVQEGDILATFDSEELELAAKQAELTDKAAQSGYENTLQTGSDSETKLDSLDDKIDEYEKLVEDTEKSIDSINSTLKSYNQELSQINAKSEEEMTATLLQRKGVLESGIYSFQQQLEEAQSDLSKYNTKLAEYQSEKSGAEAAKLSDETKKQIEAEKELSQLNKDVADKKLEEAQAGVVAEFDGLVTDVQAVKGSMATEGGALFTVADLSSVKVQVNLTKHNLESVEEGQSADVTIAGEEYAGEVTRINRQAVSSQSGAPVITAEITVEDTEDNMYLGIEASVSIHTASAVEAVSIPAKALNTGVDGDFCYVVDNGFVEKRDVVIGANDGEYIEILEGVEEDEDVITVVTPTIEDGMEVYTIYDEEIGDLEDEELDEDDSDEDSDDEDDLDEEDADDSEDDLDEGDADDSEDDLDEDDTEEDSDDWEEEFDEDDGVDVEEDSDDSEDTQDDQDTEEDTGEGNTEVESEHNLEESQEGDYGV